MHKHTAKLALASLLAAMPLILCSCSQKETIEASGGTPAGWKNHKVKLPPQGVNANPLVRKPAASGTNP